VLDEESQALLKKMASSGWQPVDKVGVVASRRRKAEGATPPEELPVMEVVEDHLIGEPGAEFQMRMVSQSRSPTGVVVYLHGGGWTIGGIGDSELVARSLASETGCAVLIVGYRLAPEHRYPAALDDAWSAVRWASDVAAARGVPLVLFGESAGGNLAAVVAQQALELGGPQLELQVLVYPVLDSDFDQISYRDPANQLLLSRESSMWFWDQYAPAGVVDRSDPSVAPLRRAALQGIAPAVILTAEHDVLRDEGKAYADRLAEVGSLVGYREFSGQMHGFFTMVSTLPASRTARHFVTDLIKRHLGGP